jgi:hypothetical protein
VLLISAGPSLSTLNTTLLSDSFPEEVTLSRLLKMSSTENTEGIFGLRTTFLFPLKKLRIPRKSKRLKRKIKSKRRGKSKV